MSADQTNHSDQNTQSTPNASSEQEGRQLSTGGEIPAQQDADAQASGNPESTSTQQNMGDGSGIRGDYGNASQTNGAEGTSEANAEGAPKQNNQ
ncbi:hypothetical protein [Hymenobacter sp. BT190]|uniref:hypothetical protein n=1 Tax=Hymenobacter sp. BT190 TaxID=2763505 RepID=UPI0016514D55|nr:hypothetical protein [Hymenobacter sp. BT190]MBC6696527.1 hypothetical protein [Hymenobacter sp. BT190]